jgi:hypothetical protein
VVATVASCPPGIAAHFAPVLHALRCASAAPLPDGSFAPLPPPPPMRAALSVSPPRSRSSSHLPLPPPRTQGA